MRETTSALQGAAEPAGSESTCPQAMLLLPDDHGFVVRADSRFCPVARPKEWKG